MGRSRAASVTVAISLSYAIECLVASPARTCSGPGAQARAHRPIFWSVRQLPRPNASKPRPIFWSAMCPGPNASEPNAGSPTDLLFCFCLLLSGNSFQGTRYAIIYTFTWWYDQKEVKNTHSQQGLLSLAERSIFICRLLIVTSDSSTADMAS